MQSKAERNLLLLILLVTFLKGVAWAALTPLWQAPDEYTHFSPIQFIAETGRLPGLQDTHMSKELCKSINMLQVNVVAYDQSGRQSFTQDQPNPVQTQISEMPSGERKSMVEEGCVSVGMHTPPFYYLLGALVYRLVYNTDFFVRTFAVRILSVILTTLSVYFSYLITQEIFPKRRALRLSVAIAVSFHPMMTFLGSVINTDSMLFCLSTILIYLSVRIALHGITIRRALVFGIFIGLGILTKPHIYSMFLPIGAALLTAGWSQRKEWRRWIYLVALIGMVALLVGGWGIYRSVRLNDNAFYANPGNELWGLEHNPNYEKTFIGFLYWYEQRLQTNLLQSYWGNFGWLDSPMPDTVFILIKWLLILSFTGLVVLISRYIRERRWEDEQKAGLVVVLAGLSIFLMFIVYGYMYMRAYGLQHPSQGRYLLNPIAAQMLLFVVGLTELVPEKFRSFSHAAIRTGFIGMNVLALTLVIVPRYYILKGDPTPAVRNWISLRDENGAHKNGVLVWPQQEGVTSAGLWLEPDEDAQYIQVAVYDTGPSARRFESEIISVPSSLFPLRLNFPGIEDLGNYPFYVAASSVTDPDARVVVDVRSDYTFSSPVSLEYSNHSIKDWWQKFTASRTIRFQQGKTLLNRIAQYKPPFFQGGWLELLLGLAALGVVGLFLASLFDLGSGSVFRWVLVGIGTVLGILFLTSGFELGIAPSWIDVSLKTTGEGSAPDANIAYDLVCSLDDSTTQINDPKDLVSPRWFTIDEISQPVLWMHAPSSAEYRIKVPPDARLVFDLAMAPETWNPDYGDGVQFLVVVSDESGDHTIFSEAIDPKHTSDDRGWLPRSIDLSAFSGQWVSLRMETQSLEDNNWDWSMWGMPRILTASNSK